MKPLPSQVQALFDGHEEYLTWSREIEGNNTSEGRMVLGMRAGPSASIGSLLHEMAHLVEIDDARCHRHAWGLEVTQVEVLGEIYTEPRTFQCSIRELRVTAIQKVLSDHLGCCMSLNWWGPLIQYLPDWWAFRQYFGDAAEKVGWNTPEWRQLIRRDLVRRVAGLEASWVLAEWHRKSALLRGRFGE